MGLTVLFTHLKIILLQYFQFSVFSKISKIQTHPQSLFGQQKIITQFPSLNFHHSSLITHHSSLIFSHSFGNITFIFITQFFHTIHGSHTCQPVQCFFFFFNTQLTEANIKKKKKTEQPTQEKKKSKVVKSCSWYCLWVPYVCLITKMPLSYELWKLKTTKSCFQFP